MASSMAFLALSLVGCAWAQRGCDGSNIPEAQGMADAYPKTFTVAQLVPGDSEAQDLYNAIVASNSPALAYAPSSAPNGVLSTQGYNAGADPNCWWSASSCKVPKLPGLLEDYYTCTQPSTWGYTFDDGPTCEHNALYDFMERQNQTSTLYYIGQNVLQWPLEAQKGYLGGHEICAHTWSHHYTTSLTNEQVFAELYYTKKIIKQVTGASVRCWRPPYGDVDDRVRAIASALDMRAHIWDHDTFDWELDNNTPVSVIAQNYRNIITADNSDSGVVVLAHEVSTATCAAAIAQYPAIKGAYDHVMPVSSCNNDPVIMAEDDLPLLPTFTQYNSGARGGARSDADFWNDDPIVFMGNGTASEVENTSSAAPPAASTTGTTSTQPASGTTSAGTGKPSIIIGGINAAQMSSSGTLAAPALSLSTLFCLVGLLYAAAA